MIDIKGGSSCQLFSGYIGTGKSTILLEMQTRLEAEGYVVLRADASRYHDLHHPISPTEMVIILAAAIGDQAGERLGKNLRKESYFERLKNFMQTEINLTNIRFSIDAINMQGAFKDPKTPFSKTVRDHFSDNLTGLKEDCHEYIRECADLLKRHIHGCKGVVFILDSLERLKNGVGYEFDQVMSSIIQILSSHGDLLRCEHIHAIYTVPPYLGLFRDDIHFDYDTLQSEPLPVVKVRTETTANSSLAFAPWPDSWTNAYLSKTFLASIPQCLKTPKQKTASRGDSSNRSSSNPAVTSAAYSNSPTISS